MEREPAQNQHKLKRATEAALRNLLILKLRGKDLNLRPLGYEPNELPLLHPAVINYKPECRIVNGTKTAPDWMEVSRWRDEGIRRTF